MNTDAMVMAASEALTAYTAEKHVANGLTYPPVTELQAVSKRVAAAVIRQAFADGVAKAKGVTPETADAHVEAKFWHPTYLPMVPAAAAK